MNTKVHLSTMLDALINDDGKSAEIAFQQYMVGKTREHLNPENEPVIPVTEGENHLGEKEYNTFAGWKAACKKANPNVVFEGDKDICNAKPGVGEWDGVVGCVYKKEAKKED